MPSGLIPKAEAATSSWRNVNYDPSFGTPQVLGQPSSAYQYWYSGVRNGCGLGDSNSYISGGVFHARQSNPNASSWSCYGNALVWQGHFPWMHTNSLGGHCEDQEFTPDWDCPRGVHGLRAAAQSDFPITGSWKATLASRGNPANGTGAYHVLAAGFYFWFPKGPVGPLQHSYLEAQVIISRGVWEAGCTCWQNAPLGWENTWNPGNAYGYGVVVGQLNPGQTTTGTYDLASIYRTAMERWGLPTSTQAVLVGIEVGTEGFGVTLNVDFGSLLVQSYIPEPALADLDFNRSVNILDISLLALLYGTCPSNWGTYEWRANQAGNSCVGILDLSVAAFYYGQTY